MRRSRNAHKQATKCHLPTTAERMLVARCKAGSHAAFVELIQQGSPIARRAIRSIVRNTADVDDVMQDTAIAAFRGLRSFNERSKFSTWLTRIAINNALMLLRRQKNKREISLDFEGRESDATPFPLADKTDDPERALIRQQSIEGVRKAVHALPRTLREYAERRCLEELSNLERNDVGPEDNLRSWKITVLACSTEPRILFSFALRSCHHAAPRIDSAHVSLNGWPIAVSNETQSLHVS